MSYSYNPYVANPEQIAVKQRIVLNQVYLWMSGGVFVSGLVTVILSLMSSGRFLLTQYPVLFIPFFLVEIVLVLRFNRVLQTLRSFVAGILFFVYAILNGVTLAFVFGLSESRSVESILFITAGMLGLMAAYGHVTRRDLSTLGSISLMILVDLVLAFIVNLVLRSDFIGGFLTYFGLAAFIALIAYDMQTIKRNAGAATSDHPDVVQHLVIVNAVGLYFDQVNLFLRILQNAIRRR